MKERETKTCPECNGSKGYFSYAEMQVFPCDSCCGYGYVEDYQPTERNTMNYSTAVMLINPTIRAVRGAYEKNGNTETFKTIDQNLVVGDLAIVETGTRWGMTVFKITDVDVEVDFDSSAQIGWVVGRIDQSQHDNIKTMEQKAIDVIKAGELRKRREDIKKNTLDAVAAGEIEKLDIVSLGTPQIANQS